MASIQFLSNSVPFNILKPAKTANWLKAICLDEGRALESLTYIFCSDAYLGRLNKQYLNHTTYTDILSFDYSEGRSIQGEVYISIPRVRDNARKFDQPFETELRRVVVHGLLHFLGYKDKSVRQKAQMRRKEEACLSLWK